MDDISPREFGALQAEVSSLRRDMGGMRSEMDGMRADIKHLVAMAERGKGAMWAGMTIAAAIGSFVSWAVGKFWHP